MSRQRSGSVPRGGIWKNRRPRRKDRTSSESRESRLDLLDACEELRLASHSIADHLGGTFAKAGEVSHMFRWIVVAMGMESFIMRKSVADVDC